MIRDNIVTCFWSRSNTSAGVPVRHPLSMIFAGPSGNGKTELAKEVAELLNRPRDNAFLKIDCGKLTDDKEVFGMSGAYYGSSEGSALNNFVVGIAQEQTKIGVMLLDEIDKAERGVITALYQVLDKGEWTNKQLVSGSESQTSVVSCQNIIFIMTVNSADSEIVKYAKIHPEVYTANKFEMAEHEGELERKIEARIQTTVPFTKAFVGRIVAFVPFLPMSEELSSAPTDLLHCEMLTVAKLLIEKEQDSVELGTSLAFFKQIMTSAVKYDMAKAIVRMSNQEAGVRSIQKYVHKHMGRQLMHQCLVTKELVREVRLNLASTKPGITSPSERLGLVTSIMEKNTRMEL